MPSPHSLTRLTGRYALDCALGANVNDKLSKL
jgi:hypothetical protein